MNLSRYQHSSRFCIGPGVWVLFALLLKACVSAPPAEEAGPWAEQRRALQAMESWQLRGRVNVRYETESHTPRIQWQQQGRDYRIRLWGTFNAGNTVITGTPGQVTMDHDGELLQAASPEQLILDQLGYELPVSYLEFWIRGLPAPDSRAELEFNDDSQLTRLQQDGWIVQYADPRSYDGVILPRRVEINRPERDLRLRFVGLNWTPAAGVADAS